MGSVISRDTGVAAPGGDPLGMQWLQAHVHVGRTYPLIAVRVCHLGRGDGLASADVATDDDDVREATAFALALARRLDFEGASLSGLEVDAQLRGRACAVLRLKVTGVVPVDLGDEAMAALARRVLEEEAGAQRWLLAGEPCEVSVQLVRHGVAGRGSGAAELPASLGGDVSAGVEHAAVKGAEGADGGHAAYVGVPEAEADGVVGAAHSEVGAEAPAVVKDVEERSPGGGVMQDGTAPGERLPWARLGVARPRLVLGGAVAAVALVVVAIGWGTVSERRGSVGTVATGEAPPSAEVGQGVAVQAGAPGGQVVEGTSSEPQAADAAASAPAVAALAGVTGANAGAVARDPAQPTVVTSAAPPAPVVTSAAAPAPVVTSAAAPAPVVAGGAAPGAVIDFSPDRAGTFGWRSDPRSVAWFDTDGYHLGARQPGRFVAVGVLPSQELGNVVVRATYRKVGGPSGGGYGILVGDRGPQALDGVNQQGNYVVFEVGDKGEVGVWRREDDRWVDILAWTPTPAVHLGNAENTLEVRASAGGLSFIVNGTAIAMPTLPVSEASTGGVGLFLGGDNNEAVLTRLIVTQPD